MGHLIAILIIALVPLQVNADCGVYSTPTIQELSYMNQEELERLHCQAKPVLDNAMGKLLEYQQMCYKYREAYGGLDHLSDSEVDGCYFYVDAKTNMDECDRLVNNIGRVLRKDHGVEEVKCEPAAEG